LESGSAAGAGDWADYVELGSEQTMVVEDCSFIVNLSGGDWSNNSNIENIIYGHAGGRLCIRHCDFDYTQTPVPMTLDAHGDVSSQPNGWGHSVHLYEVYECTFRCQYTYRYWSLRGGIHIFHDNKFEKSQPGGANCIAPKLEVVGYPSGSGAPPGERIQKSYFWNNTFNGTPANPSPDGQTSMEPREGTDYFNRAPQSGDEWHPYTPLVYPHPLVSGASSPEPPEPEPEPAPGPHWLMDPVPETLAKDDSKSVELGTQFIPSADGKVTAIRFFKGAETNAGPHTGALWDSDGNLLAQIEFRSESASGWQEAKLEEPVKLKAGETYIVSYHAPLGHYSVNQDAFLSPYVSGSLKAIAGCYLYGPETAFPTTVNQRNYWVDVHFKPKSAGNERHQG
jgi:hypothetical protein